MNVSNDGESMTSEEFLQVSCRALAAASLTSQGLPDMPAGIGG